MKRSALVLGAVERDARSALTTVCEAEHDAKTGRKLPERRSQEWYPAKLTAAGWAIPDTPRLRAVLDKHAVAYEVAAVEGPDSPESAAAEAEVSR